jgi:hypothetical protein
LEEVLHPILTNRAAGKDGKMPIYIGKGNKKNNNNNNTDISYLTAFSLFFQRRKIMTILKEMLL